MELKSETVRAIIEAHDDWHWCNEYGEPGYRVDGTTPAVVLGDYWCRCGKVLKEDGTPDLHDVMSHHPRVFAQLEAQGVAFEWEDEWTIDSEYGKAYRTSPDSYSWQQSFRWTDDGEMVTPDDDIEAWIAYAVNDPIRCLPRNVWKRADLEAAGFVSYNGQYEAGWHPGQTDDPRAITELIRERMGDDVEIVFYLDDSGQFDVGFSAWTRRPATDSDSDSDSDSDDA
jgi:hypothetical protein